MSGAREALRPWQEGGADLDARGAQRQGRADPARVGDAAGRDHRQADRVDDLRHQRHQPDRRARLARNSRHARPPRSPARSPRRAPLREPARLGDRRRVAEDRRPSRGPARPAPGRAGRSERTPSPAAAASTTAAQRASNGRALGGRRVAAARPSRVEGCQRARQPLSSRRLGGAAWQKKLRSSGPGPSARTASACSRIAAGVSIAQGSEPTPPPAIAAAASASPPAPAIGAWITGTAAPSRANRGAGPADHQWPVFGIDAQGSAGGSGRPSAAARSRCCRACGRRPCGRRAAAG